MQYYTLKIAQKLAAEDGKPTIYLLDCPTLLLLTD